MYHLSEALRFPSPHLATEEGIVAVGGDLRPERVLLAYQKGIFPWFEKDDFLIWWSPDPRMVLFPDQLRISKSMRTFMRKNTYEITFDKAFNEVVKACARSETFLSQPGVKCLKELCVAITGVSLISKTFMNAASET